MSTIFYNVEKGDNLEFIACKFLGNPNRSGEIQVTNGLKSAVIYEGQQLRIETDDPPREPQSFEKLGIIIDGKKLINIPAITIERSIDKIAGTFNLVLPNDRVYEDITQPFGYQKTEIYWKDELIFTGRVQRITPSVQKIALAGYELPGILSSVNSPKSTYPRTRYNVSLEQQARRLCKPFGVKIDIRGNAADDAKALFSKTTIEPEEDIAEYLSRLAKERNLFLFSDESGYLVISKDITSGEVVGEFEDPQTLVADYNGNSLYSDYYAIREQNRAHAFADASAHIDGMPILRQKTIRNRDRHEGSMKVVVQAEMQRCLFESMSFSMVLPYVTNSVDKVWTPGDIIQITSPKHRIYKKTLFIAKSVKIEYKEGGESATLQWSPLSLFQGRFRRFW